MSDQTATRPHVGLGEPRSGPGQPRPTRVPQTAPWDGASGRIDAIFARRAAEHPDRVAVCDGGPISYGTLWRQALALAAALHGRGVAAGDPVAVLGYASHDSILAMLGVLAAGAHFVPIDPAFPGQRAARMIEISGARILLCADDHEPPAGLGVPVHRVRNLTAAAPAPGREAVRASGPDGSSADLAYIIFTSGSTGEPKPVGVPHRAIVGLVLRPSPIQLTADDTFLAHTTLVFDASMLEIWSALLVGARVVCAPGPDMGLHEIADLVSDPRVTVALLTPAIFALMVDHRVQALRGLRILIVGGDVMPANQAARLGEACPNVRLVNCYGPTEDGVVASAFPVAGSGAAVPAPIPIGAAVTGTRCYVLDPWLRPVRQGEVGELYLGGDRLAVGYLGNPALTAERFLPDPFTPEPGARMYRTGDLARFLPSGMLGFEGRYDDEVKVRGFRINLAEARAALAADPEVHDVVVIAVGTGIDRALVAFVRPASTAVDTAELRARAWQRVPRYLVPDTILFVDSYPLGPTGKVDRDALLGLWQESQRRQESSVGPSDEQSVIAELWRARTGALPSLEDDFFGSGATSLDLIRLIEDISTELRVDLDFADVYGLGSFTELVDMVRTRSRAAE